LNLVCDTSDDAKATEYRVIMDCQTYDTNKLLYDNMTELQGPALIFMNNYVLKDSDYAGIVKIGKRSQYDDPSIIGKFGLGWHSIFHFTDCPSFFSGDKLTVYDPQECYLGTRAISISSSVPLIEKHMLPFWSLIGDKLYNYQGTIFRLPLRTSRLSSITSELLSLDQIYNLLKEFTLKLCTIIASLRYINKIEIIWREGNTSNILYSNRLEKYDKINNDIYAYSFNIKDNFTSSRFTIAEKPSIETICSWILL